MKSAWGRGLFLLVAYYAQKIAAFEDFRDKAINTMENEVVGGVKGMKQLNIIVDNKVGTLADISFILGKARINIESISTAIVGEKAIIVIYVKDEKRAREVLQSNNYKVLVSDAFVVKMPDEPGELSKLSKMLADNGVNIEGIHVLAREGGTTLMSVKVDKSSKAEKMLQGYIVKED
ncbi:ACT domain protein [Candidatus Anstonella stagnisolia]|nr:ACT domain protein [Candidatus Anstonella stagnisolia]